MLQLIAFILLATGTTAYVVGSGVEPNSGCNVCNPVQGNWGEWGPWSQCMNQYGSWSQTRQRVCSSGSCPGGSSSESQPCTPPQNEAPQWSEWGPWGGCSATCGGGICQRTRVCNNGCSSCQCVGNAIETKTCNTQPCCSWGAWSGWSACSATCGAGGYRTRTRQCSCVSGCVGNSSEQEECNAQIPCPVTCNTCQPQYEPPICTTCNQPPVTCTTCNNPCLTCGGSSGSGTQMYDPYSSSYGRKRRFSVPGAANNSTRV